MPALDSDVALNRGIQLCRVHVAPPRELHDTPPYSGTTPAVVVGPGNNGKVQRIRERDYAGARSLNHPDALGCAVAELNCVQPRETMQFVVGQLGEVPRNREDQHGD